ncbi:MAG TPA: hypothetical protein VFV38_27390 [Ktedonobacteraceae bacterium]|nr:hypothetical protein [Ktedonobacteraceae bacterium]
MEEQRACQVCGSTFALYECHKCHATLCHDCFTIHRADYWCSVNPGYPPWWEMVERRGSHFWDKKSS